ncbi:MAG TPA: WXG100 family type VII secretion target [Frankiaceae bacterium]|nr:WXG100 family type VII secretion target [Frankiaceae bacterium]
MTAFRLDVDPAAVEAAGRSLGDAAGDLAREAGSVAAVAASFAGAWEGAAATTAVCELDSLARHLRAAAPRLTDAERALVTLAGAYREADDTTVPALNKRWAAAHARYAAEVADAARDRLAEILSIPATIAARERADTHHGIETDLADRIADARAELDGAVAGLTREFDALVDELRRRSRAAGDLLSEAVVLRAGALAFAAHRAGMPGWLTAVLTAIGGPDAVAAFAGSLPLGTLATRGARLADDDVEGLGALVDAARAAGLTPRDYGEILDRYWLARALRDADIDPERWVPQAGAARNKATIEAVYTYYGRLYLDHPELEWAAMANQVGASFAAGMYDMESLRKFGRRVKDAPAAVRAALPRDIKQMADALAGLTEAEAGYYETTLLTMQRDIFNDQARMHAAYVHGGLAALEELHDAGMVDDRTIGAWRRIDKGSRTGNVADVRAGNRSLLHREQHEIIGDSYDQMRRHSPTGPAVTWAFTLGGKPSVEGARGYADVFPERIQFETPGPHSVGTPSSIFRWNIPHVSADNPVQGHVKITTPFPDGNIASRDQRWRLIVEDTLPTFVRLADRPDRLRALVETPIAERIADYRLAARWDEIARDLVDVDTDLDQ